MNIFQFAADKERRSERYYRELAEKTSCTGLRNILTMLADEEATHGRTVQRMRNETPDLQADTPVLANARKVFETMRGSARQFNFQISEADLYRKARDIEQESKAFYLEKAEQVKDPAHKAIFQRLAAEEDKHLLLMENIVTFVSRPETYLEDAEFSHLDNYVNGQF
jgi:rubrerythrin